LGDESATIILYRLRAKEFQLSELPPFASIHRHGLIRVAAATPLVTVADPRANAQATIALWQQADVKAVDLAVFPELGLSGYAIDDLHMQDALLGDVEQAIGDLVEASEGLGTVALVGAPIRRNGRIYNCALAIARGLILGVVPKTYLPNYREFYEKRWFASGAGLGDLEIEIAGHAAPFGVDLIFAASTIPDFIFHIEICEDFWAPVPPSSAGAMAGALILCNLSASNIVIGKADDRTLLASSQAMRTSSAYVYSAAGAGESTTDLAWDGQGQVNELGSVLASSARFAREARLAVADVDVQRLRLERMRTGTFNDCAAEHLHPEMQFRRIAFDHPVRQEDVGLIRKQRRFPYVPDRDESLDQDCYEAFNIQVDGLVKRMEATNTRHLVIGVSGGLDSTHALIVAAKACDILKRPRDTILGYTMPGFATGSESKGYAWALMKALGIDGSEINIRPAAEQMLKDMDHPYARGEKVYDIAFENVQAGLRTDYLFRLANRYGGFVVGTGDLSELALGWCTYGVGDHMSHYAVNSGVPKTLIQYLIRWAIKTKQFDDETSKVLHDIVGAVISPELIPADGGKVQSTEEHIGPYALHDFFLFHILRYGLPPSKVAFLAWHVWQDATKEGWPAGFPDEAKQAYDLSTIVHWLEVFLTRFFQASQYKRSAIPNGPKVSAGGALSPRGDWRAPSDSVAEAWLRELREAIG
jgi:NAD+ synthase (glutamine-hydrolysing)